MKISDAIGDRGGGVVSGWGGSSVEGGGQGSFSLVFISCTCTIRLLVMYSCLPKTELLFFFLPEPTRECLSRNQKMWRVSLVATLAGPMSHDTCRLYVFGCYYRIRFGSSNSS